MLKRHTLTTYVVAVIVVWVILIALVWFLRGPADGKQMARTGLAFLLGMFAMWIAVHVYGP